jgi:hypothetical protein
MEPTNLESNFPFERELGIPCQPVASVNAETRTIDANFQTMEFIATVARRGAQPESSAGRTHPHPSSPCEIPAGPESRYNRVAISREKST